jgi:hypothetical protein
MRNLILVGALCLVVGGLVGFFVGRMLLEKQWSQPAVLQRMSAAHPKSKAGKDANLVPKQGTLLLGPAPIARARMVLADVTKADPVVMAMGDVGNGDEGLVLNLDLKNRSKCQVTAVSGTAYGYDAYGRPSTMNAGGEYYVAFDEEKIEDLGPDQVHSLSVNLHYAEAGFPSMAVAHVDSVICSDGTKWNRTL